MNIINTVKKLRSECQDKKCTTWFGTGFISLCSDCLDKLTHAEAMEYHEILMKYYEQLSKQREIEKEFVAKYWSVEK